MSTLIDLKKMFDELSSNPKSDTSPLHLFDEQHHRQSLKLLAVIDELDRMIADTTTEKASRRKLLQARTLTAQHFARHLDADPTSASNSSFTAPDGRQVWVITEFTGTPTRAGRQQADEWTDRRGQPWAGNIKRLRATMRQAFRNGDQLPDGHFGLRVGRTIKIGQWSEKDAREWDNVQPPLGPDDIRF